MAITKDFTINQLCAQVRFIGCCLPDCLDYTFPEITVGRYCFNTICKSDDIGLEHSERKGSGVCLDYLIEKLPDDQLKILLEHLFLNVQP